MLFDRVYRLVIGQSGSQSPVDNTPIFEPPVPGVPRYWQSIPDAPAPSVMSLDTPIFEPPIPGVPRYWKSIPDAPTPSLIKNSAPIGPSQGGSGLEITSLRIQFEIEKTAKKNPNTNKIRIWNLKKATRAQLEMPGTKCLLYAGYSEEAGPLLIFQGGVTYAWTKFEGPDVITEFEVGDGAQEIRDSMVSVGYGKGIKSNQILKDAASKMGLPLTMASNAPERSWQNGFAYFGSARTLLDKVTKASNLEWSVQNGNLQVLETGMVTTRQGIEIALDSGMVGSPEREREAKAETTSKKTKSKAKAKQQWDGWKVKTFLMPQLNPGDRVHLKSRSIDGIFRIEELKHTGDNWEGDWQTELKLVDPAKPIGGKKSTKGGSVARGGSAPGVPTNQRPESDIGLDEEYETGIDEER